MGILRTDKISGLETPTAVTGSVSFDGSGDYLSFPSSSEFNFGAGNWTVEGWIYMNSLPASGSRYTLASKWTGTGDYSWICNIFNDSGNMELNFSFTTDGSSATNLFSNGGPAEAGKWYHIAYVRDGGTLRQFVNGVQLSTNSISGTIHDDTQEVNIGRHGEDTNYMNGYFSNVRIIKGTALYTSNFTPPTHELEVIGGTVLLCCNNPDSATAASYAGIGTSVTLTANGNVSVASTVPGLTRDFTFGTQFEGVTRFDTQGYFVPPSGTTEQRGRGRGVFGGGYISPNTNIIDFIQIQTQGTSQDFGDLTYLGRGVSGCSSSTRGIFAGGAGGTPTGSTFQNIINFVTISSTGNAVDFGDFTPSAGRRNAASLSNNTRGLFAGGQVAPTNDETDIIDFITISSLGDAVTFGTLSSSRFAPAGFSNTVRGLFCGGTNPARSNVIDFVTIASTGNAVEFGNLSDPTALGAAAASGTRGVFAGGYIGPTPSDNRNIIEFVTIASTGNTQDFGDLVKQTRSFNAASNSIRAVFVGGYRPNIENGIDFVLISSTGNAVDFGDLITGRSQVGACSDAHGGLS